MTKIEELQRQTEGFLTQQTPTAVAFDTAPTETAPRQGFDFFSTDQMDRAFNLTNRFMALANSIGGEAGLEAVIEEARKAENSEPLELVKFSLMVFIVHHPQGSRLPIPPLEKRAPEKLPLLMRQIVTLSTTITASTDLEAQLDWYREDPLANSHHEHWHIVYPWRGIPDGTGKARIQDRQGELFFYMHQQMLARYDTERIALGLPRVKPMSNYTEKLMEGYTFDLPGYDPRPPGLQLVDIDHKDYKNTIHELELRRDRLLNAVDIGRFETIEGSNIPVNADLLGATIESTKGSVSERSITSFYGNHHGSGHRFLSYINNSDGKKLDPEGNPVVGVMADVAVAICDPIFYRWHKHIDDISFRWQELQQPQDFSDAPKVLIRKGLNGTRPESQSPDIILAFTENINSSHEANFDGQAYGEKAFGGENWDKDFSTGEITTNELHTMMLKREVEWRDQKLSIDYLDHREFCYFLRIENLKDEQKEVTVRIFLVAKDLAEDRQMWIEMDKFRHTLQSSQRAVIYRPAALSSVIQKPAEKPPKPISKPSDEGDKDYCNCGWPYNLLLPRSTQEGMEFFLMVTTTDWEKDRVSSDAKCGSMSFCGAKDSYPDRRPMGYPFDRPFPDRSIMSTIAAPYHLNMAVRDITIKWIDS
jgi:tyrosinase